MSVAMLVERFRAELRQRRLLVCGAAALALHLLAALLRQPGTRPLGLETLHAGLLEIELTPGEGGTPGGGSPVPDPEGPPQAPEEDEPVVAKSTPAPRVREVAPREPDALLASAFGAASFLTRTREPKASIVNRLGGEPRKLAEPPSNQRAQQARYQGSGPGANGGPGGLGAGYGSGGRVTGDFAFGGSSGALRAEMCFIPPNTQRLRDIPDCVGGALFFSDELNVPSRRFDEGFPGVSERNEWFTITYRGVFRVKRGGLYEFRLKSDDGSMLFIDQELVVDHDGVHDAISKRGVVDLDEGAHQIAVRYFQGPRYNIALQLFVTPPGQPERLFSPEL